MLRCCLNPLLIALLFLPPGICVCAATTTQGEDNSVSSSSHDGGLPDSHPDHHPDHLPGCPALERAPQATPPELKPQLIGPVQYATHLFRRTIWTNEFRLAYHGAPENGFAATPPHILKRVLLI